MYTLPYRAYFAAAQLSLISVVNRNSKVAFVAKAIAFYQREVRKSAKSQAGSTWKTIIDHLYLNQKAISDSY